MIFVNSMSDLFHEDASGSFIRSVFGVMESASWHTFQVLTKRPERALELWQFRFSDRYSEQLMLLPGFDQRWLADMLRSALLGQEMSVGNVRHFVLTKTPCYLYVDALKSLEQDGSLEVVKVPLKRKRGSFAAHVDDPDFIVRFQQGRGQQELFPL
jgi:hypothetical protein